MRSGHRGHARMLPGAGAGAASLAFDEGGRLREDLAVTLASNPQSSRGSRVKTPL